MFLSLMTLHGCRRSYKQQGGCFSKYNLICDGTKLKLTEHFMRHSGRFHVCSRASTIVTTPSSTGFSCASVLSYLIIATSFMCKRVEAIKSQLTNRTYELQASNQTNFNLSDDKQKKYSFFSK